MRSSESNKAGESGELLTVDEVAARLAVGRWAIYSLIRDGELPGIRIRRLWRVPADAVQRFVELGGSVPR